LIRNQWSRFFAFSVFFCGNSFSSKICSFRLPGIPLARRRRISYIPLLTLDDYRALPETGLRYQLVEGDFYLAPAPNRFHQDISRNLQFDLHSYLKANPIGKLYDAPFDVYLDEHNVFQTDLIVVLDEDASILTEAGAEGAPEFIVEILSPKMQRLDLVKEALVRDQGYTRTLDYRP
jgi:Uma2 family endonuclease